MDKKKILQFEDEVDLAAIYAMSFAEAGLEYKHYLNPPKSKEKLINLVVKEEPDLIIMDILMPVMNGFEATKILRSAPQTQNIPIFGTSNMDAKTISKEIAESGMMDYFCTTEIGSMEKILKKIRGYFEKPMGYESRYKIIKDTQSA